MQHNGIPESRDRAEGIQMWVGGGLRGGGWCRQIGTGFGAFANLSDPLKFAEFVGQKNEAHEGRKSAKSDSCPVPRRGGKQGRLEAEDWQRKKLKKGTNKKKRRKRIPACEGGAWSLGASRKSERGSKKDKPLQMFMNIN